MNDRSQSHYIDAERLLAVAESTGTDTSVQTVAALASIAHALLAGAPRRARRQHRDAGQHGQRHGGSPRDRWLLGRDTPDA